ncbi:hypothetical protein SAMN04489742_3662 [Arthrobacter crystallopoietes]|uniref:Uncharacterized protein n=1 Tax=Crystallibacter crystallopoietes TaxID=37928 RepID=A0A1H1FUT2_9MICC|nr:hypothetical protein AC20117_21060 [Arthrobacter crystallopoietes]MCW2134977.1 hypothetical protein [Arthrobacter sp. VKM Ac-2550]SDR04620.1 hypothetical protein SAMN04489742_3662 [Arthrobacter crystallopoietes]
MSGYLIQYNRRTGRSDVQEFPGADGSRQAMRMRLRLERERLDEDVEIASINAASLESLQATHSRYFGRADFHGNVPTPA